MKPDAWCTIAVRFIGFLLLIYSSIGLSGGLSAMTSSSGLGGGLGGGLLGMAGQSPEAMIIQLLLGLIGPIMQNLLGLYLFFGGRWVVRRLLMGVDWPGRQTCSKCGYELAGIEGGRCPECGAKRADQLEPRA
jgi:hypothetical protein